jgi:hypothetical protein
MVYIGEYFRKEYLSGEGLITINEIRRYRASSLCIIWKSDSILLEQFPKENVVITFRPVGGTIEYGEDSMSAVIREVKEESTKTSLTQGY